MTFACSIYSFKVVQSNPSRIAKPEDGAEGQELEPGQWQYQFQPIDDQSHPDLVNMAKSEHAANFAQSQYLPYRPGFKNHRGLRTTH